MSEIHILTADQMRLAEQSSISADTSAFTLMERAGHAAAIAVLNHMPDYGRVVIVAGPGNNGGDGFATAYFLRQRRIPVTVVTLVPVDALAGHSKAHADKARDAGAKIREASSEHCLLELGRWLLRAVMVVDAVFGTGLNRPLQGKMREVVERINQTDRPVLSIDIASGVCADTGVVLGDAVRADFTLPIAATKWGHWLNSGRDYTGELLDVAEIGIDDASIRKAWVQSCASADENDAFCINSASVIHDRFLHRAWPHRRRLSHKGSYGHVWIFGGSSGFTGAPQLAGHGAYAAGAGLVSIVCPDDVWSVVASSCLEVMVHRESQADWHGADAVVVGPGWGKSQALLLSSILESDKSTVIDADALNIIAESQPLQQQLATRKQMTVITPHPGEAARLLGTSIEDVQGDRKKSILALTSRYACWVVLKGSETLVASPQKDIYLNPFGSAQLAIAGSGDVLSGMIGAQLARTNADETDPGILISATVALHGKAGEDRGWYLAGELAGVVAEMRQRIEQGGKTQ